MGHFSDMFNGLTKSMSIKRLKSSGNCGGREVVEAMVKEAKKNELVLKSSGTVSVDGSNNFISVFSKRGKKGVNQDCSIVWEVYMLINIYKNLISSYIICTYFNLVR